MGLFGKVGAFLVALFGNLTVRTLALKIFLKLLIYTALPVVIMVAFNLIFGQLVDWISIRISEVSVGSLGSANLTGLAAYFYYELGVDIAFGAIVSACAIKLTLRSIPFLRY